MKKFFSALIVMLFTAITAGAQGMPAVPLDPNVRMGTLPNGLTYYIRHNEWPQRRADFYIAQKVGSMQEEEEQRGLAHFLEHMCFNGTTHFPGDGLKQYLERIGVRFGENLNAYTSFDETVYNINNVNVDIEGAVDSCILILHDWSHDLLLEGKEIDKERGVINEEWRLRRNAMMRMQEKAIADLFPGNRYGQRMPIGTMDVVMNFPHETLREYYRRWYRPDLQGLVIVGDVDPAQIESKLQQTFADIKAPAADAARREYFPVEDNKEPLVTIQTDKEQNVSLAMMFFKYPAMPREMKGTMQFYLQSYVWNAACTMLSQRVRELLTKPNPPFAQAYFGYEEYFVAKTTDALNATVVLADGAYTSGLAAMYRELVRAQRFGFTESEYSRFQQEFLSQLDAQYAQRDKVENSNYVNEYVRHFLDGVPAPGIEWEHETMKQLVPAIPLEVVNQAMATLPTEGRAIAFFMPEKEGTACPTKDEVLQALADVDKENIEGFKEEIDPRPLVEDFASSATVKKSTAGDYGSTVLTLSNGIRVHLLPTDHEPNSIRLQATSWGGTSLYPDSLYLIADNAQAVTLGGLGQFSAVQLHKKLSGIQASASPFIGDRSEGILAQCVKKDVETMLQLVYLLFQEPRRDDEVFASTMERTKAQLANADLNPRAALSDSVAAVLYDNNVRALRTRAADIDRLDYSRMLQIYRERFADPGDFEFYLVGDFQTDSIQPLLLKYIGGLPNKASRERYKTISKRMAQGQRTCIFDKEQDTPNANVNFFYHAAVKDTPKNEILGDMLEQVLTMMFTESVREDEGGSYGVPCSVSLSGYPRHQATAQIMLPTAPDKLDRMKQVIAADLDKLCAEGPTQEQLQKIKEYMVRSHAENLKKNQYWMQALVEKTRYKSDSVTGYEKTVQAVKAADIQKLARKIFKSGNCITVGMKTPTAQ